MSSKHNKVKVMVDLETMGKTAGCVILSIGAVVFNNIRTGEEFYCVLNRTVSKAHGMHEDPETVAWWNDQSEEARAVLRAADATGSSLMPRKALIEFAVFLERVSGGNIGAIELYGNGSDFDNAILSWAYNHMGVPQPWKFWNNRCYRTLKSQHPDRRVAFDRNETAHNALADARAQARHASTLLRYVPMNGLLTDRPPIICLCGSTRFRDAFEAENKRLTTMGCIVLTVGWFSHSDGEPPDEKTKARLDDLHKRKIDLADSVQVLNVDGYIGESTQSEIAYANLLGKPVNYLLQPSEVEAVNG